MKKLARFLLISALLGTPFLFAADNSASAAATNGPVTVKQLILDCEELGMPEQATQGLLELRKPHSNTGQDKPFDLRMSNLLAFAFQSRAYVFAQAIFDVYKDDQIGEYNGHNDAQRTCAFEHATLFLKPAEDDALVYMDYNAIKLLLDNVPYAQDAKDSILEHVLDRKESNMEKIVDLLFKYGARSDHPYIRSLQEKIRRFKIESAKSKKIGYPRRRRFLI